MHTTCWPPHDIAYRTRCIPFFRVMIQIQILVIIDQATTNVRTSYNYLFDHTISNQQRNVCMERTTLRNQKPITDQILKQLEPLCSLITKETPV
jgi:hypothetical protein